jgi:hypothetical protein
MMTRRDVDRFRKPVDAITRGIATLVGPSLSLTARFAISRGTTAASENRSLNRLATTRQGEPQLQQTSELFWLAFLLTGSREVNIETVVEGLDLDDTVNSFFERWMVVWSRKLFIATVLGPLNTSIPEAAHPRIHSDVGGCDSRLRIVLHMVGVAKSTIVGAAAWDSRPPDAQ